MMRKLFWIIAAMLVFAAIISPVWGANPAADKGLNGKGKAEHLYLFEKDPGTWAIIDGGAWGKLTYLPDKGTFCFNGHNLTPDSNYSLIYYPDPWPGYTLYLTTTGLGTGIANEYGDVHITGTFNFTTIPTLDDTNSGAKIWLVLAADHDGTKMIAWNPTEYLFEYDLINKRPS